ncbi:sodium:solute symporter family protein [Anaerolentibacter hominis]|uniref:sodium:solute symporter family protein n=1 Tax=Anaerolentibacter hominis TaxID=3079009 RepID=UPI0031B80F16
MNVTYVVIIAAYMVVSLVIAFVIGKKKTNNVTDYSVGGRSFGGMVLFFTMLATIVGASSVMGRSAWIYKEGFTQVWYIVGIAISYFIYIFFMAPKIHDFGVEHNGETIGDWVGFRYNKPVKYISSVLIVVAYIAITAFQYIAMATILNFVTGIHYNVCLLITAAIVITYTSLGGLWAVASTDVMQGFMTLAGVVVMVPMFLSKAGGISAVFANAPAAHLELFGYQTPLQSIASVLVFALGIISWPDVWQRCYAAKDKKILKKSFIRFVIAYLIISAAVFLIGFAATSLIPGYDGSNNNLLPFMIMQYMPDVLGAVLLSALMAVIMGTADSTLLISSVMLEKDIIKPLFVKKELSEKQNLRMSKIVTAVCGIAVLGVLFFSTDMFDLWIMSADITGATLAVPILFGFAIKKGSSAAALASIIFGFAGWLASYMGLVPVDAILLGAGLSLIAYVVVMLAAGKKGTAAARAK